jgi:hypothetical protein
VQREYDQVIGASAARAELEPVRIGEPDLEDLSAT